MKIHQIAVDFLVSKVLNAKVKLKSIFTYVTAYTDIDFADDDLINKRAAKALISAAGALKGITVSRTANTSAGTDARLSFVAPKWVFTYTAGTSLSIGTDEPFDNFIINGLSQNIKAAYTYNVDGTIASIIWDGGFNGTEIFKIKLLNF